MKLKWNVIEISALRVIIITGAYTFVSQLILTLMSPKLIFKCLSCDTTRAKEFQTFINRINRIIIINVRGDIAYIMMRPSNRHIALSRSETQSTQSFIKESKNWNCKEEKPRVKLNFICRKNLRVFLSSSSFIRCKWVSSWWWVCRFNTSKTQWIVRENIYLSDRI